MSAQPFIGEIITTPYNFAPKGFAFCAGQLLPISQNTALFSLLGTTYGGDGRTTFALPDMRGSLGIHFGQGTGLANYALGESLGQESVTLNILQLPAHTHQASGTTEVGTSSSPANAVWAKSSKGDAIYAAGPPTQSMNPSAIGVAGGSHLHENRQPFLALNFCIALVGIFPARG